PDAEPAHVDGGLITRVVQAGLDVPLDGRLFRAVWIPGLDLGRLAKKQIGEQCAEPPGPVQDDLEGGLLVVPEDPDPVPEDLVMPALEQIAVLPVALQALLLRGRRPRLASLEKLKRC